MSTQTRKRAAEEPLSPSQVYEDPFELANSVTTILACPDHPTMVANQYSNEKNPVGEVQAYAKIAGKNWTYYVKSLETTIGRNTDVIKPGEKLIDIDLGPAKVVSRRHATITYNLQTRVWELNVFGRNGAKIDTSRIQCGEGALPAVLKCGTVMDIGGTQMMFILPDTTPQISPNVLNLAAQKLPGLNDFLKKRPNYGAAYFNSSSNSNQSKLTFNNTYQAQQQNGFKGYSLYNGKNDNDTYFNNDNNNNNNTHENSNSSSNSNNRINVLSTMKSSHQNFANMDTDLSKEESKDIKPPYSYATMITQAILSNEDGVLSLSEIYEWISSHYSFYRYSKTGWQNSIRHNLSLNKAFEKVPRRPNEPGKGMKWQIAESYKQEFLKSLANGSMTKIKRGSSVSRQLQLHLATHSNLPNGMKNADNLNNNYQPPRDIIPEELSSSAKLYLQQLNQQYSQQNHTKSQQTQQQAIAPSLSYMAHAGTTSNFQQPLPQQVPSQQQPTSVAQRNISQPMNPSDLKNSVLGDKPNKSLESDSGRNGVQTPSPKISRGSTNSNKENNYDKNDVGTSTQTSGPVNIDLMSFSSPSKGYAVSALEAYTPERGSSKKLNFARNHNKNDAENYDIKNQNSDFKSKNDLIKSPMNNNNTQPSNLQASPAIWNFVQFGTPTSQTPKLKKEAAANCGGLKHEGDDEDGKAMIAGSPILQRKNVMSNNGNGDLYSGMS